MQDKEKEIKIQVEVAGEACAVLGGVCMRVGGRVEVPCWAGCVWMGGGWRCREAS